MLATDDDLANDDEDGILLHGSVSSSGTGASVTPSVDGFVDAWVDFDNDGVFHPTEERVLDSEPVFVGLNNVVTLMPNNPLLVVDGERYARFRFSTAGGLGPTGEARDGEVEDYKLIVSDADPFEDWGDAPLSYGTVWPFGAGHTPDPLLRLGTAFDLEGDGQPSDAADGDDLAGGIDDEDGVTFGSFIPGLPLVITVTTSEPGGWVQGWFDENDNGMFEELAEWFLFGRPLLQNGVFVVQSVVDIPPDLFEAYFRFRISEWGWLGPTGYGGDGEVEDYFLFALPFDHTVSGSAIFDGGRYEGACTQPPVSGFSDTLIVTTHGSTVTTTQPSTGDVNTGSFDPSSMTFDIMSEDGESYTADYLPGWSFSGVNRYPVGSSGCIYIWDVVFHPGEAAGGAGLAPSSVGSGRGALGCPAARGGGARFGWSAPECGPLGEQRARDDQNGPGVELPAHGFAEHERAEEDAEDRRRELHGGDMGGQEALQEPGVAEEAEAGNDEALVQQRGGEIAAEDPRIRLHDQAGDDEDGDADRTLGQHQLVDGDALGAVRDVDLARAEQEGGGKQEGVAVEADIAVAAAEAGREHNDHPGVGDQGAQAALAAETVAGDEKVSEQARPEREGGGDHGGVPGGRAVLAHVHERELHGEDQTDAGQCAAFGALDAKRSSGDEGPADDGYAAEDEPHPAKAQRRSVVEAGLDRDGVAAPEGGEEECEGGGGAAQGAAGGRGSGRRGIGLGHARRGYRADGRSRR